VIGFVVGRSDEWLDALNHYRRRAALIGLLTRPWLVLQLEIPTRLTRLLAKKLRGRNGAPRTDGRDEILGEGLSIDRLGVLAILAADSDFHQLRPAEHLLKAAHGFCRTHGLSAVRASVHRENLQSRFLYRRLGYVDREASDASKFVLYYLALT
jgi:ribosomal protein S18 acetylase RimI-like enzyme